MLDIRTYLSFRFSFTVGATGAAARLCGVGAGAEVGAGAGAGAAAGFMVGAKENAEGPEGVSEGGLEANEKPDAPVTNAEDPPRVKAEGAAAVVGTGKIDEADVVAAAMLVVGPMLKGDDEEEKEGAVGAGGVAVEATPRLGKALGADVAEDELVGVFAAKEPVEQSNPLYL